jgi:gliding motility-associated-like protein
MLQTFLINLRRISTLYPCFFALLLFAGVGRGYGQITISVQSTSSCASSPPSSTVTVHAIGTVGTTLYALDLANPPNPVYPFQANNFVFNNVAQGTHIVTVLDNSGNPATSFTFTIDCLNLIITQTSASCGSKNGTLRVATYQSSDPSVAPALVDTTKALGYLYSIDLGTTWQSSPTFNNLPAKIYDVWVKDPNNTVGMTSFMLGGLIKATPNPTLNQNATCANNDGIVDVTATGVAPPYAYKIDNGTYGTSTTSPVSFSGLTTGDHTVWVEDANGCEQSAPINVPLTNNLQLTMGADPTICQGKTTVLNATSPNGVSFSWTPTASLVDSKILRPIAKPTTTTTYTLVATWGPCTQTGTETVIVNPAPVANAGTVGPTCYGKSIGLNGSGTGVPTLSYSWRPSTFLDDATLASPTVVSPTATTIYHLQVTDGNNCTSLNNAEVKVTVPAPPQLFAGNDTNVVAGQPVPLHAVDVSNSGFLTYEWTPAIGLMGANNVDAVVLAAQTTQTYTVKGTTAVGCVGVDSMTVKVFTKSDIFVPNAFSPNHDGHNDVLRVVASSIQQLHEFAVFDRGGAKVFTTSNAAVGWDGTWNGRTMPPGVYVWMAVGWDWQGRLVERKGTVVLVR